MVIEISKYLDWKRKYQDDGAPPPEMEYSGSVHFYLLTYTQYRVRSTVSR